MNDIVKRLRGGVTKWGGVDCAPDAILAAADEIERLRLALRIIAGYEQCIDNLMSHGDVARAVLKGGKP